MRAGTLSSTHNLPSALGNTAAEAINYHDKFVATVGKVMLCFAE